MKKIIFAILLVLMAYESQQNIIRVKDKRLTIMKKGNGAPLITKMEKQFRMMEEITSKIHNKIKSIDSKELGIRLSFVKMQEELSLIQYKLGIDNNQNITSKAVLPGKLLPVEKMIQAINEIRAAIIKHQHTIHDKREIPRDKKLSVQVEQYEPQVEQDADCVLTDEILNDPATIIESNLTLKAVTKSLNETDPKNRVCFDNSKSLYKSFVDVTETFNVTVLFTKVPTADDLLPLMLSKDSPVRFAKLHGNTLSMHLNIPYMTVRTLREYFRGVRHFEELKNTLFSFYPRIAMKLHEEIAQLIGLLAILVVIALLLLFAGNYRFPRTYLKPATLKLGKLEMVINRLELMLGAIKAGTYAKYKTDKAIIHIKMDNKASRFMATKKQYDNELEQMNHTGVKIYFPDNEIGTLLSAATSQILKEDEDIHRIRVVVHNVKQKQLSSSSKLTV